jgi:hypothetical protein
MIVNRSLLISAAALLLLNLSSAYAAEEDTVQAAIPWEAEGRVFQVDTNTAMFLGAIKGIMYVESSRGEMHEGFVMCPFIQTHNLETGVTDGTAYCEISASPENVVYAEMSCQGEAGECTGTFTLVDGVGDFAGISGEGALRIRSPMRALISDMANGAELGVASGLALIKDLKISIP